MFAKIFKIDILYLPVVLWLAACSSTASTPAVTASVTPRPSQTATPTYTPAATPTHTPTNKPTETPTPSVTPDRRVITTKPSNLVLWLGDLPKEGRYIVESHVGYLSNDAAVSQVVQMLGPEVSDLAQAYIEDTHRTTGYAVSYVRTNSKFAGPISIYHQIDMFTDVEDAVKDITNYKPQLMEALGNTPVDNYPMIGDATIAYQSAMISRGQKIQVYVIVFSYRNTTNEIATWGNADQYTMYDLIKIAEIVLEKLKQAPLVSIAE